MSQQRHVSDSEASSHILSLLLTCDFERRTRMRQPRPDVDVFGTAVAEALEAMTDQWTPAADQGAAREAAIEAMIRCGFIESQERFLLRRGADVVEVRLQGCGELPAVCDWEDVLKDMLRGWVDDSGRLQDDVVLTEAEIIATRLTMDGLSAREEIRRGGESASRALNWAAGETAPAEWIMSMVTVRTPETPVCPSPETPVRTIVRKPDGKTTRSAASGTGLTPEIPEMAKRILHAMFTLNAVDRGSRVTRRDVVTNVTGTRNADQDSLNRSFDYLRNRELIASSQGRSGGIWLTENGLVAANAITSSPDKSQA